MGQLVFQATLGGQVNLVGPNTASTFNLNVPAVAGNLITSGDTGTVTNTMLAGSIANAKLTNSSVTVGSTSIALGATSTTLDGVNIGATTAGTGAFTTLSGSTSTTTPIVKSASSLTLQSNGTTTAVTIDTSQNFMVNTTTPQSTSAGRGNITLGGSSSAIFNLSIAGANSGSFYHSGTEMWMLNSANGPNLFFTNSTERMRISSTGIVTMNAYGAGAATFSASGVISSVSDETWKIKDGAPVDPISMLNKLEPGYWYYNDEKKEIFGIDRQLGFYAQNVNAAIGPEAAPNPE